MKNKLIKILKATKIHYRLSGYRWYRKFHGGRWELHHISLIPTDIWIDISKEDYTRLDLILFDIGGIKSEDWG